MKALDLFCCAGGTCEGLQRAGFEVYGVDIELKHAKHYPGYFIHGDAMNPPVDLHDFDIVWASPPCQAYSIATKKENRHKHPDLIEAVRNMLSTHPFTIIENVVGSPLKNYVKLSGPMFGLERIYRERRFELSFYPGYIEPLKKLRKNAFKDGYAICVTKSLSAPAHFYPRKKKGLTGKVPVKEACEAMGITHEMTAGEVGESIPPVYAEYMANKAKWSMETNNSYLRN